MTEPTTPEAFQQNRDAVIAKGRGATLQEKHDCNVWDDIADVLAVLKLIAAGRWCWTKNTRCKYIDVRIDMRSGACIIKDRDGKRILPQDLEHQHGTDSA